MKIVKSLKDSGVLMNYVFQVTVNEIKKSGGFLSMTLGNLGASLLGNLFSGKGVIIASDGVIRTGHRMKKKRIYNAASPID